MFRIKYAIIILSVALLVMLIKHFTLKAQIKNLTKQIIQISNDKSEKMLDISLIDRDLEQLVIQLNRNLSKKRYIVANALRHEEHLKESIVNISHDLRTPLTVIMGHLQLLQKTTLTEKQQQRIDTVLQKANRLKDLINAFYDLSVVDSSNMQPKMEKVNFSNLFTEMLVENAPLLEKSKIEPKISLQDTSIFIMTDKNMLERILQNLLTNAIRYTVGEIFISLSSLDNGNAVFQIENVISSDQNIDVDRLFDRFYKDDKSRNTESTGLGLSVVKILTEKLGGIVTAKIHASQLCIRLEI